MTEGDEVLDRAARAGHVVDVDAGHVEVRAGALEDDREAVADQGVELRVVDARAGDDQAVGMLRAQQAGVRRVRALGRRAARP